MKTLITIILSAFVITTSISQEKNIETKSVEIDNLISFVVQNYFAPKVNSELEMQNITFLIQVPETDLSIENQVVLKQAFKLLSTRLTENDFISIVTYSGFNGIALKQTEPKDLKRILYSLNNLKSSVKEFHNDGIELAYNYAKNNFKDKAINTVVMVRNPNLINDNNTSSSTIATKPIKKKNSGAVLITALSLLPELIAVIKN